MTRWLVLVASLCGLFACVSPSTARQSSDELQLELHILPEELAAKVAIPIESRHLSVLSPERRAHLEEILAGDVAVATTRMSAAGIAITWTATRTFRFVKDVAEGDASTPTRLKYGDGEEGLILTLLARRTSSEVALVVSGVGALRGTIDRIPVEVGGEKRAIEIPRVRMFFLGRFELESVRLGPGACAAWRGELEDHHGDPYDFVPLLLVRRCD